MKTLHKRQRTLCSGYRDGVTRFSTRIFFIIFPGPSGHGFVFECFQIHEIIHICEQLLFLPSTLLYLLHIRRDGTAFLASVSDPHGSAFDWPFGFGFS
jgi:hypothetical protein